MKNKKVVKLDYEEITLFFETCACSRRVHAAVALFHKTSLTNLMFPFISPLNSFIFFRDDVVLSSGQDFVLTSMHVHSHAAYVQEFG